MFCPNTSTFQLCECGCEPCGRKLDLIRASSGIVLDCPDHRQAVIASAVWNGGENAEMALRCPRCRARVSVALVRSFVAVD